MSEVERKIEKYSKGDEILRELMETVKQCQKRFGDKKEIATEENEIVSSLCLSWEDVLCYGLKIQNSSASLLKNVQEIVYGSNDFHLWKFCQSHLTVHEQERFNSLENVTTKRGKLRALIRASLNERSLERYLYMWLGDLKIIEYYDPWALMLSPEAANLLPSIAAGLSSILFSIIIDCASIDGTKLSKKEPVIFVPAPIGPKKRTIAIKRHILSSDDSESVNSESLSSDSKDIDKESIGSNDEATMDALLPIIEDILRDTFQKNLIEDCLENSIQENNQTNSIRNINSSSLSCEIDNIRTFEEKLTEIFQRYGFLEGRIVDVSSIRRTISSLTRETDQQELRDKIEQVLERFAFLDRKVADITSYSSTISSLSCENDHQDIDKGKDVLERFSYLENRIPDGHSIRSTISSLSSGNDHQELEYKLKEALERCTFLEERIAELSLQNRRLQRLLGVDCNKVENFSIAIPRSVLVNSGRKSYRVYQIRIHFIQGNDDWLVEKRYSEFYKLHQRAKKKNDFVRALDFPPKKFGNLSSTFIEERRQRLQIYLRHLLALLPETSSCKTKEELQSAFAFLKP